MEKVTYGAILRSPGTRPLYVAAFLARIPMTALPLVFTLLVVEGLGGTYGQAGLVAAAETIGAALGAPWRGRLLDRVGLRRSLAPSLVALAVIYPLVALASLAQLVVLAFLAGLFLAPVYSIVRVALAAMVPESHHRTAFALDSVAAEAAFIIGPAAGGALVVATTPHVALLTVAATVAVGLAILWWVNPPTRTPDEPTPGPESARGFDWVTTDHWYLFLVSAGAVIALMATDLGIIAALREHDAIGLVGVAYLGWGAASLAGGLVYGARPTAIRPSIMLLVMGVLTIPIGFAHTPVMLALACIPAGFLCAPIMTACSEWIARLTSEARRGEAMGWQATSFTVGAAVAAPAVGVAMDRAGAAAGFALGGAAGVVIALVAIGGQKLRRRPVSELEAVSTTR